jgi:cell wall-associated NlpC family hydrolase
MQALGVSLAPAPQRAVVVDTALPPPPADAPIAVPEPGDWDFAPAPENQPETPAQDAAANASVPDPDYDPASQAELITLIDQVLGTPYVSGGDSPAGTDCWGLASWVSNVASGQRAFGDRFSTSNEESAPLARGFQYGTAAGAL